MPRRRYGPRLPVYRPRRAVSHVGVPCGCGECQEAGVAHEAQRRIPGPAGQPLWLHGWLLRRWLDAQRAAFAELRLTFAKEP